MLKNLITREKIEEFSKDLTAQCFFVTTLDITNALDSAAKNKQCRVYDYYREINVAHVLRSELIDSRLKNLKINEQTFLDISTSDAFTEIIQEIAFCHCKEVYIGININRVLIDLSDTPYHLTKTNLLKAIDSFLSDLNVQEAYLATIEYIPEVGQDWDDDLVQRVQSDLEFNFQCALLDCLKESLGIPGTIDNDPHDTHTICYDAVNEYDVEQLIDRNLRYFIKGMAVENYDLDLAGFIESADILTTDGYIESLDGDCINWNPDLTSLVAYKIYNDALRELQENS